MEVSWDKSTAACCKPCVNKCVDLLGLVPVYERVCVCVCVNVCERNRESVHMCARESMRVKERIEQMAKRREREERDAVCLCSGQLCLVMAYESSPIPL